MSTEADDQLKSRPAGKLFFDPGYLEAELGERVNSLQAALAAKRAECLRIEGQIGEATYWLALIRTARPAGDGDGARGENSQTPEGG